MMPIQFSDYVKYVFQGRKRTLVFASTGGGLTCLAMAFLPKDAGHSSLMMVLYFVGRVLSEAMAYTCWYYTAELYPTNLRSQAIGFCSSTLVYPVINSY